MLTARMQTSGRSGGVAFQLSNLILSSCAWSMMPWFDVVTMLTTTVMQIV